MTEPYTVERPLLVLTRQATPEDENKIGVLETTTRGETVIPYFMCFETHAFLHRKRLRARVAREIESHLSENCVQVFVVIHKHDYQFVYAQLGLVDELLKLLHGGVHLVLAYPDGGKLMTQIVEVIKRKKRRKGKQRGPRAPLIESFDMIRTILLTDLLKRTDAG